MRYLAQVLLTLMMLTGSTYSMAQCGGPVPKLCDADGDFDVDSNDIAAIGGAKGTPTSGPGDLRDVDGDGMITVLDARQCVALCDESKCTNLGDMTPEQKLKSLEDQGLIPKLDRSNDYLQPDLNGNGIRDDVESYIETNYQLAAQRLAVTQLAQTLQAAILVDKTDAPAVKAESIKMSRAVNCVYSQFEGGSASKQPSAVIEQLEAVTANTRLRLLEYLAFSKALDGSVSSIPEGNTCE